MPVPSMFSISGHGNTVVVARLEMDVMLSILSKLCSVINGFLLFDVTLFCAFMFIGWKFW